MPAALAAFGNALGAAFQKRRDLQAPICNMLRRVCAQTRAALRAGGDPDGAGYGERARSGAGTCAAQADVESVDAGVAEAFDATADDDEDLAVPDTYTMEHARANRECLRALAGKWMPELLNRYVGSAPNERSGVGDTISALAVVLGDALVGPYFKEALTKVVQALKCLQVRLLSMSRTAMCSNSVMPFFFAVSLGPYS